MVFYTEEYNFLLIPISTILISLIFWYLIKIALRNSIRTWYSYNIKITDSGILREYEIPIYHEFQKTEWTKKTIKILWENVKFDEKSKLIVSDKTINTFGKIATNNGMIIIPNEIENKNELKELIKLNIENKNCS